MRTPLIAGNWKMYKTVAEGVELVEALLAGIGAPQGREVLICPPFTALHALSSLVQESPIRLGAQDVWYEIQGAFTGAIAPGMLRELGCDYVIVGHSERRAIFGEDDALVNKKLRAALGGGLLPILCVGETRAQRESGAAEDVVVAQVRAGLADVDRARLADVVIAYEPVWAIGTGLTASAADAQAMHATIRAALSGVGGVAAADAMRIQYGGSVKPENVDELMAQPDIDGALVGGAALQAVSFLRIVGFTS